MSLTQTLADLLPLTLAQAAEPAGGALMGMLPIILMPLLPDDPPANEAPERTPQHGRGAGQGR